MYDYNPELQSPNENPEAELAFREGDLITITGPMDEVTCDTWYHGRDLTHET